MNNLNYSNTVQFLVIKRLIFQKYNITQLLDSKYLCKFIQKVLYPKGINAIYKLTTFQHQVKAKWKNVVINYGTKMQISFQFMLKATQFWIIVFRCDDLK